MIKLLIFDLDDTLYSETDYVYSGFRMVAAYLERKFKFSRKNIYADLKSNFNSGGRGKNFDFVLRKYAMANIPIKELVKVYRGHKPDIKLYPGAARILAELGKNYKLCLLTNGWPEVQARKIKALLLEKYFDSVYLAQTQGLCFAKPHKRYFMKILNRYKCRPDQILVIGDEADTDKAGARNLGMHFFMVSDPRDLKRLPVFIKTLNLGMKL